MTDDWRELEAKFAGKCITCGEKIEVGEKCKWKQGSGIRHVEECEAVDIGFREDNSALVILDKDWNDPKKYEQNELLKKTNCQCCGNSLDKTKDTYMNVDRRTCEECFLK